LSWQENLISNLIAVIVLATLGIIIYCKVQKKNLVDVFKELKEIFSGGTDE